MFGKILQGFVIGFVGLAHALRSEQNLRNHVAIGCGVIAAGFFFPLEAWEWIVILLCIGLVVSAECMNTAVERVADRVSLEKHPLIKQAKDCSSAAVLVLAITSAVVGSIVFVPKISAWIGW